ncbi:hypothetical protein [Pseudolysinimonas sp.]|jgi:hypothetical protein|uniref:hypothetical protein n=1 Tax=Pseudolysinimonas sp. TaxID=2680009 RepID=UPI00378304AD
METTTPRILDLLDRWLTAYAAERTGRRRDRLLAVGARARECLEAEADRIGTDSELLMLAFERERGAPDAAARVIDGDALPILLLLLTTERWLPHDRLDRRAQLQVLGALGEWLSKPRVAWFGSYCDVLTLQVEVDRVRALEQRRARQ